MTDPHWTSYVGMATGIVGVITGISGSIMGYVSYKRSSEIKSLDLRLELRKTISDFNAALSKTEELLPYANQSRERVAAATGNRRSGAMVIWKQQYERDQVSLREMSDEAQRFNKDHDDLSPKELETELVAIHSLRNRLDELKNRYDEAVRSDDRERERIKDRHEPR